MAFKLQQRYPKKIGFEDDNEIWVLLDYLADEDLDFNIERFEFAAKEAQEHANALRLWKAKRSKPKVA